MTAGALAAHPASEWPLTSHLSLLAIPGVVPLARQHARRKLAQWHVLAHVSSDTEAVQLIVSELVTNAIRAYPGETQPLPSVQLWLSAGTASVLVQVWDANDSMPVLQEPDTGAAGGRGLMIVEALSKDWGAYRSAAPRGKIVWAVVCR